MISTEENIRKVISKFGIEKEYLGTKYLSHILMLTISDEAFLTSITKLSYVDTAKYYRTSIYCVERDLRTFIKILWEHGDNDFWEEMTKRRLEDRPTNSEFITYMTNYLQEKFSYCKSKH